MFLSASGPFNDVYLSAVVSLCDRKEQGDVFQCQSAVKKDERNVFTVTGAASMQH